MKNNIAVQIGSGYGDLRKSEKQAADYILNHMEEAAELPLDRLAQDTDGNRTLCTGIRWTGRKDWMRCP